MAIENILEKIEQDNRERASGIISEAESRADELRDKYRLEADELRARLEDRFREKAREHRRQMVVSEQLELRKKLLGEKRRILEDFYNTARDEIRSMSGDRYAGFIRKLILERAVTGNEEIVIPPAHRKIFSDKFVDSLNREYGNGSFTVSPDEGDFEWGFILREKDRLVDMSLESFFGELVEDIEPEVARILFSQSGRKGKN
ncbi:MAG: hypothetical protein GF417_00220 [Candidatus Latescibacteria bacterium]|nr:hypothetical protein [bacterium]MBD3422852.1 hypothetical protein [Candidatus Latescibacterota bacterium]